MCCETHGKAEAAVIKVKMALWLWQRPGKVSAVISTETHTHAVTNSNN